MSTIKADKKLIGIRIMQQRKLLHLTQEVLAEKIGISKNHLSSIECGKHLPTTAVIFKLCDVRGKTPDYYLIGGFNEEKDTMLELIRRLSPTDKIRLKILLSAYLENMNEFD